MEERAALQTYINCCSLKGGLEYVYVYESGDTWFTESSDRKRKVLNLRGQHPHLFGFFREFFIPFH